MRWSFAAALVLLFAQSVYAAGDVVQMRLRIEWGGGSQRRWQGTIAVDDGQLSAATPLGIEADESGTMWIDQGRLVVRSRSLRAYDGVDVLVTAPLESKLRVSLTGSRADGPAKGETDKETLVIAPLKQIVDELFSGSLDTTGNRLLARRTPGDKLRVSMERDSLVFGPGEKFDFNVQPYFIGLTQGTKLHVNARLMSVPAGRVSWTDERELTVNDSFQPLPPEPLSLQVPEQEGVYDLVLVASRRSLTDRLGWRTLTEERRVQLAVVAGESPNPATPPVPFEMIVEIDPANPAWWDRLKQLPLLPGMRRGPLGNGDVAPWQHSLGPLVQLGPGGREPDISWEAYPLPVGRPGQPHLLEIEYPSDVPQTLGISIIEPNAAGAVGPIGLDSGFFIPAEQATTGEPKLLKHRLVFWPHTSSPLVLMTNRQHGTRATYGKVRLLGPKAPSLKTLEGLSRELPGIGREIPGLGRELPGLALDPLPEAHLPRAFPPDAKSHRLLAAYFDRPLLAENFSAEQSTDGWSGQSGRTLDDWTTMTQASSRLAEYVNYVGYNAAVVSVLADGSTLYPSSLVESTPRYDDGALFANGQDPVRKDVLELMLRVFDREQLRLVPAIEFSAPLAELEAIRRRGGSEAVGIELIGRDGRPWLANHRPRDELAPYYNPLNSRVQEAMLAVISEVVDRCAKHSSFEGIAIQLAADGYAQMPGAEWGYDEDTLARFERETRVDLGPSGADELPRRVALLAGRYRDTWLQWRAKTLSNFYRRAAAELSAARPQAVLFLAMADVFHRNDLESQLRPSLPQTIAPEELLLNVGIDPKEYREITNLAILRPRRYAPMTSLEGQAANLQLNQSAELDAVLSKQAHGGAIFKHERQEARLASFDAKSPFRKTHARLVSIVSPSGASNRQRFTHAMATDDCQTLVDGGWLLPMGQEDDLREMVTVFRQLPAQPFETLGSPGQPAVVRCLRHEGRAWLYAVNDSPWNTTVTLPIGIPDRCRLEQLGTRRAVTIQGEGVQRVCTIDLGPYELVGAVFSDENVQFASPKIKLPGQIAENLEARIRDLWSRTASLKNPSPFEGLANADFEQPARARPPSLPGNLETSPALKRVSTHRARERPVTAFASLPIAKAQRWRAARSRSHAAADCRLRSGCALATRQCSRRCESASNRPTARRSIVTPPSALQAHSSFSRIGLSTSSR